MELSGEERGECLADCAVDSASNDAPTVRDLAHITKTPRHKASLLLLRGSRRIERDIGSSGLRPVPYWEDTWDFLSPPVLHYRRYLVDLYPV